MTHAMRLYAPEECNGVKGYPPEWHATIKHRVREEAGHRCVRCGHPYRKETSSAKGEWSPCDEACTHFGPYACRDDHTGLLRYVGEDGTPAGEIVAELADVATRLEAQWRILTVHHLSGIKADCRWFNCVALCQVCHLVIQGRVKMEQVFPYEHSPWFRPYAAAYYASVYLGEELTRGQTMERLDELLALERV
jgi:hypothetical protein